MISGKTQWDGKDFPRGRQWCNIISAASTKIARDGRKPKPLGFDGMWGYVTKAAGLMNMI